MAGPLRPISQFDYSGGANPVVSPFLLGPKQSQRIHNMILDKHGFLNTVDGTLIQTTAPASETGSRLLLPILWNPVSGAPQSLVIANRTVAPIINILYDRSVTPWVALGNFQTDTPTPTKAILNDVLVMTDGYSAPKSLVSGTFTFQSIATAVAKGFGGQSIIQHEGFLYLWNTRATTGLTDGPSVLRQSDLNDPNTWNDAQIVFIAKDDGTQGMGMAVFTIAEAGIAPTDTLVLFKNTSTYQMTGNLGTGGGEPSSNLSIQQVKTDMGNIAIHSIQFCTGFGIIRLSHKGFALYEGVDDRLISEEIRPYIFGHDDITGLRWDRINYSWASQSANPPLYICFCPTVNIGLTRAFIYDLIRRAWTIVDLPFSIASIEAFAPPETLPYVLLGDTPVVGARGNIRRWFAGDNTWDGVEIIGTVRSRPAFEGSPMQRAYFRRLQLDITPASSPTAVTIVVTCNSGETFTTTYSLSANPNGSHLEASVDHVCNSAYYDLTVTGKISLTGHEFHVRRKPVIGSNTLVNPL